MKSQSVDRLDVSGLRGRYQFYLDYHNQVFPRFRGSTPYFLGFGLCMLGTRAMKTQPWHNQPSIQCMSVDTPHEQHGNPPKQNKHRAHV